MWSDGVLDVNPACHVTVHPVGSAGAKVVLADNFYAFPERVAELALEVEVMSVAPTPVIAFFAFFVGPFRGMRVSFVNSHHPAWDEISCNQQRKGIPSCVPCPRSR